MNCLYCGDCCQRMSPLSYPNPCPKLIVRDGFYFCSDYENRPEQCKNHIYPFRHCPFGIEKLKLDDTIKIAQRIDEGWELLKNIARPLAGGKEKMSCPHNNIQGDNYGETCMDCGKVLSGYGYWAEGSRTCLHRWLPYDDEYEVCSFCEEMRKKLSD